MNYDIEELLRAAAYTSTGVSALETLMADVKSPVEQAAKATGDASRLASEVRQLVDTTRTNASLNVAPSKENAATAASNEKSVGETVLETAAMVTA